MSPRFEPFEPRWTLVRTERDRCQDCGALVATVWKLWTSPTTSSTTLCEPCVEKLLDG